MRRKRGNILKESCSDVALARRGHGARRVFAAEDEDLALVGRQRRRVRLAPAVQCSPRAAVYAVYAISSLDTEPFLRHRTQNMQFHRDTTDVPVKNVLNRLFRLFRLFRLTKRQGSA